MNNSNSNDKETQLDKLSKSIRSKSCLSILTSKSSNDIIPKCDSTEFPTENNDILHRNGYVLLKDEKKKASKKKPHKKNDKKSVAAEDKKLSKPSQEKKKVEKGSKSSNEEKKKVEKGSKSSNEEIKKSSQDKPISNNNHNKVDCKSSTNSKFDKSSNQPVKKRNKDSDTYPPSDTKLLNLSDSIFQKCDKEKWFHGMMIKDDVKDLISTPGTFLVYIELLNIIKTNIILSCNWNGRRLHFIIQVKRNEVKLFEHKSKSLSELINNIVENKIPIHNYHKVILQSPVPRQSWELKKDELKLVKRIGQGNFGDIWNGTMKLDNSEEEIIVAIKVPKVKLLEKYVNIYSEMLSEVRFMKLFKHENIVKFYGACFSSQPFLIVMELSKYGCVRRYIKKKKVISDSDLIKFAIDISLGVGYLHSNLGIHCDIASRNCLIFPNKLVKLADFGQAIILKKDEKEFILHNRETQLPLRWLSAETIKNSIYSYKTDVYSFGMFVWELFNNCNVPFEKMKTSDLVKAINSGLKPPSSKTVLKEIVDLIEDKCLNIEPGKRPTMVEVTQILKTIQSKIIKR